MTVLLLMHEMYISCIWYSVWINGEILFKDLCQLVEDEFGMETNPVNVP